MKVAFNATIKNERGTVAIVESQFADQMDVAYKAVSSTSPQPLVAIFIDLAGNVGPARTMTMDEAEFSIKEALKKGCTIKKGGEAAEEIMSFALARMKQ